MWVHHQANGGGGDAIDYMVGDNDRDSHPTYATDKQGRVYGIVHPNLAPSSTFYENDQDCVAIELANVSGEPNWEVPQQALENLAHIIAHHALESPRSAHPIELNKPGVRQKGFYVGWHQQVWATACPGPFVIARLKWVVDRANQIKSNGGSATNEGELSMADINSITKQLNDIRDQFKNLQAAPFLQIRDSGTGTIHVWNPHTGRHWPLPNMAYRNLWIARGLLSDDVINVAPNEVEHYFGISEQMGGVSALEKRITSLEEAVKSRKQ